MFSLSVQTTLIHQYLANWIGTHKKDEKGKNPSSKAFKEHLKTHVRGRTVLSIMANRSDKRGRRKITALDSSGYQKQFNQKKLTSEFEKQLTEKTSRIGKKGLILDLVPNCLAQFDQQCNGEKFF